jgi:hypothetical protein
MEGVSPAQYRKRYKEQLKNLKKWKTIKIIRPTRKVSLNR